MAKRDLRSSSGRRNNTGHEWDGITELNKPLPKWWLWTFYATIVWAIGYWLLMPAWPLVSTYSKGLLGYSQRERVAEQVAAAKAAKSDYRDKIAATGSHGDQQRSRAVELCPCRRRGGVRRQLRALPWPRRARRLRLSQSSRQFLAMGRRHACRHSQDDPARHPLRRSRHANQSDAGLRPHRRSQRAANRRRRRIHAFALRQVWRQGGRRARGEDLRHDLHPLSWRRRQGQPETRSPKSDR